MSETDGHPEVTRLEDWRLHLVPLLFLHVTLQTLQLQGHPGCERREEGWEKKDGWAVKDCLGGLFRTEMF